jgi:hypothetical protein
LYFSESQRAFRRPACRLHRGGEELTSHWHHYSIANPARDSLLGARIRNQGAFPICLACCRLLRWLAYPRDAAGGRTSPEDAGRSAGASDALRR